jgi:hypothetical protein
MICQQEGGFSAFWWLVFGSLDKTSINSVSMPYPYVVLGTMGRDLYLYLLLQNDQRSGLQKISDSLFAGTYTKTHFPTTIYTNISKISQLNDT